MKVTMYNINQELSNHTNMGYSCNVGDTEGKEILIWSRNSGTSTFGHSLTHCECRNSL